jgi:hypothetical protein
MLPTVDADEVMVQPVKGEGEADGDGVSVGGMQDCIAAAPGPGPAPPQHALNEQVNISVTEKSLSPPQAAAF